MALKTDRRHVDSDISNFMNATAERGGIVSVGSTAAPSGSAMDQAENLVEYVATALSGIKPVGVLMNDVVNLDLTRQHINFHKDEVQIGGKVTVWKKGVVVTDRIYPGHTPAKGGRAYVGHSGYFATSNVGGADHTDVNHEGKVVGRFESAKDENGFARVYVDLP